MPDARPPQIDVDAGMVARALDLSPDDFRRLMDQGRIQTLSERGAGDDAGFFRLCFYYRGKRLRITTDQSGRILAREDRAPR